MVWHSRTDLASSMSCSRSSSAHRWRQPEWRRPRGRVIGALTGGILLGLLQSILVLSRIAAFWIDAAYGTIILVALVFSWATGWETGQI